MADIGDKAPSKLLTMLLNPLTGFLFIVFGLMPLSYPWLHFSLTIVGAFIVVGAVMADIVGKAPSALLTMLLMLSNGFLLVLFGFFHAFYIFPWIGVSLMYVGAFMVVGAPVLALVQALFRAGNGGHGGKESRKPAVITDIEQVAAQPGTTNGVQMTSESASPYVDPQGSPPQSVGAQPPRELPRS